MKRILFASTLLIIHVHSALAVETPPDCPERPADEARVRALAGEWFAKAETLVNEALSGRVNPAMNKKDKL